jgi:[ribosomal protein S18]-alanine N-acetyltransferase
MTPGDMAKLHAAAFTSPRPWEAAEFAALLAQKHCFLVAGSHCLALFRVVATEAELLTIATHPDHRRKGLARTCMDKWVHRARALGATSGFLEVAADNPAAIALYRACGFDAIATRRGYFARTEPDPVDAIVMRRRPISG